MSVCHFILLYVALTNFKIFNIELHILYYIYLIFLLVTTTEPYPGSVRHTVDFFICRFNIYFARQTKLTFSCGRFGVFDRLLLFPSLNLSSSLLFSPVCYFSRDHKIIKRYTNKQWKWWTNLHLLRLDLIAKPFREIIKASKLMK